MRSLRIALVAATMAVTLFQAGPAYAACGRGAVETAFPAPGQGVDRNADGFVCVRVNPQGRAIITDNHGEVLVP